ncbi:unnamed protein product [marine sediment metagenome]|uniref:Uncharacterized protein n=1 Tax=marine sediment metagenome TaxID=412755 RepID=X0RI83_9ZZZZ
MTASAAGYKGDIYIGAQRIGGSTSYTIEPRTRNMGDVDELGDENVWQIPLQLVGGSVSVEGQLIMGDAGQVLLETRLADGAKITDLKLFIDKEANTYWTPDASVTAKNGMVSHCIVTAAQSVGDEKSGIASFSATLKINGALKRVV